MDVATVKSNYVEPSSAGKTDVSSADQLLMDFSAAVAGRIKQTGSAAEQSKGALVGRLDAKIGITSGAHSHQDVSEQARRNENNTPDITDPPHETRNSDQDSRAEAPAPRERSNTENMHDDHPVRTDAQQETASHDAPVKHDSSQHETSSSNNPAVTDTASQNSADGHVAKNPQTATGEEAAIAALASGIVQQVNVGNTAQATPDTTDKADGQKATAVGDDTAKQPASKGQGTVLSAEKGQKAGETGGEVVKDGSEPMQKANGSKSKSDAPAQPGQNTHVKAEAQTSGEKGATVAQQQAADLSNKIGNDQSLAVNVTVTKASEELVSKPSASLAGPVITKTESESLPTTAVQASAKGQTQQAGTHGMENQPGQNGSDGKEQNQAQAQLQAAQAQAAKSTSNVGDVKLNVSTDTANVAQTIKVGGMEGASSSQTVIQSDNAQHAQKPTAAAQQQNTPHSQARAHVTDQVSVQISKAISDGIDKINIQLKPAHLGRVDVTLEMTKDGHVTAVISADNKDTLDLLKQDSRELEKALREAGMNLNSSDLSFSMRGRGDQESGTDDHRSAKAAPIKEPLLEELLNVQPTRSDVISANRVDITA